MRYLSVCSGIEAATVAWHPLGWTPVAFSEIEPFPSAVLAHHYPNVPNYGDMTKFEEWPLEPGTVDLLVGGTPCQSFSVAGLRKGISDPRGGLMLTYLEIARRFRPRWIVWENVPGVLSSGGGRDFGSLLGGLEELGYGWAYRVLDAQWVRTHRHPRAVPQRRRRVFVVGCLGDWKRAAQVLFERESVQRDSSARRASRKGIASDAEAGAGAGCWPATVASTLNHAFGDKLGPEDQHALNGAPLFVPDVVGALTAKGPTAMGAPDVDAQHYVASRAIWWDGSDIANTLTRKGCDDRMPDKDRLFAVLQPVAGTLGNRGLRSHTELDGHGAYVPVAFGIYGGNKRQDRPEGGFYVREEDTARTLDAAQGLNPTCSQGGTAITQPVPFTKSKRAQPTTDDETWVDGKVNPTLSLFDQGDTRATTVAIAFKPGQSAEARTIGAQVGVACTLEAGGGGNNKQAVAHAVAPTITAANDPSRSPQSSEVTQQVAAVHAASMTVRRLTPRECERLQGFPDDWTLIPWRGKAADQCPDGPRYKALGNSMAVNCMAWIGERIAAIDSRHDI